ncbi:MAG: hypothetical protein RLZZ156_2674 [Deinococcota bacterium]|jgi:hypothetical protein
MKITQKQLEEARVKALTVVSPAVLRRLEIAGLVCAPAESALPDEIITLRNTLPFYSPANGTLAFNITGQIFHAVDAVVARALKEDLLEAGILKRDVGVEIKNGEITRFWIEEE